jgi:hypothetical protein
MFTISATTIVIGERPEVVINGVSLVARSKFSLVQCSREFTRDRLAVIREHASTEVPVAGARVLRDKIHGSGHG